MAQSPGCNLTVDEARLAENVEAVDRICPSYEELGSDVEARIGELRGFLHRYAAVGSLNLRQTKQLGRLQRNLKGKFCRLEGTWSTMRGNGTDGSDFDEWVIKTEEEMKSALFDSEIFVEVRETTSNNHVAGEVLTTDTAEPDVVLQVTEATTDTLAGLDDTSETGKTLTQVVGDAEEQAGPTFYPDDVSELILSVGASDLCFAGPDDHLDDNGGTLRGNVGAKQTLDNDLESSPLPGLNPALTNMGEEIDTPTLFKALFLSLDPSQEPAVPCGAVPCGAVRVQQLPVAEGVQRPVGCQLYMGRCSSCGAEGNKGRSKAACPAQGKICYNCNIKGHFGRVCTTQSNLHLVMNGGPTKQTSKEECLGCGARGTRMHARDACLAQDKICHYCGVSGHFEQVCMRKNRGSPKKILNGPPSTEG
jgi:hypothetical protein